MQPNNILNHILTNVKEEKMAHRKPVPRKKDKAIFTTTANKTKKVNVIPKTQRGGIRL